MKKTSTHSMATLVDAYLLATDIAIKLAIANIRSEIQRGFIVQLVGIPINNEFWIEQTFLNVESFDLWVSKRFMS